MEKQCIVCGTKLILLPHVQERQKYCSEPCIKVAENNAAKERRKLARENRIQVIKKCPKCLKEFSPTRNNYAKYCSEFCQSSNYKKSHPEKVREWKKRYYQKHKEYVSKKSKIFHSNDYFGGLRFKVLDRDGGNCQNCGQEYRPFTTIIHHIDKDKNNNVMENLVTLCRSCHNKVHGTFKNLNRKNKS